MSHVNSSLPKSRQTGMALVIALVILAMISILGIAALRASIFNSKISTSAQGSAMTFQAAESALAALFQEASLYQGDGSTQTNVIHIAMGQLSSGVLTPIDRCLTKSDLYKAGACGSADVFDERGLLQSESRIQIKDDVAPCGIGSGGEGSQVSTSGGDQNTIRGLDYQFVGYGHGSMAVLDIDTYTVQEFARCVQTPTDGGDI
ncbi:pilus assembly PilX family protein [Alcanivorax sediminis]|nr:PilX N-terminal domain-containing pilus assembly protein [Alcanivorax sediminis]